MTNEQLRTIKKYFNMKAVINSIPVEISNVAEKLAGSNGKGKGRYYKQREFSKNELDLIESVFMAIAHQIIENTNSK